MSVLRGARFSVSAAAHVTASDDNLRDQYIAADVFLAAPCAEGFGVPMIEAPLSGLAVVSSDWTSPTELVRFGYVSEPEQWLGRMDFVAGWMKPSVKGIVRDLQRVMRWPMATRRRKFQKAYPLLCRRFDNRTVSAAWRGLFETIRMPLMARSPMFWIEKEFRDKIFNESIGRALAFPALPHEPTYRQWDRVESRWIELPSIKPGSYFKDWDVRTPQCMRRRFTARRVTAQGSAGSTGLTLRSLPPRTQMARYASDPSSSWTPEEPLPSFPFIPELGFQNAYVTWARHLSIHPRRMLSFAMERRVEMDWKKRVKILEQHINLIRAEIQFYLTTLQLLQEKIRVNQATTEAIQRHRQAQARSGSDTRGEENPGSLLSFMPPAIPRLVIRGFVKDATTNRLTLGMSAFRRMCVSFGCNETERVGQGGGFGFEDAAEGVLARERALLRAAEVHEWEQTRLPQVDPTTSVIALNAIPSLDTYLADIRRTVAMSPVRPNISPSFSRLREPNASLYRILTRTNMGAGSTPTNFQIDSVLAPLRSAHALVLEETMGYLQ